MSIFPMITPPEPARTDGGELPVCREIAWDFERDIPVFRQGEPVVVSGKEAVRVWIWKALRTPRYQYEIHSWDYGSELESLIGQPLSAALKAAEAPRYLRECLLINPYITALRDVSVGAAGDRLTITGTAETIYGEVDVNAAV